MSDILRAWHFVRDDHTLRDGSPLAVGEWLEYGGPLALCKSGLHASVRAIDALKYAPGSVACLVECGGDVVHGEDKLACSRRRPLFAVRATEVLRQFARQCALDVIHLWEAPAAVRRCLETGEGEMRAASSASAASAAAYAAADAWCAARDAAYAAQNQALESLLIELAVENGWEPTL